MNMEHELDLRLKCIKVTFSIKQIGEMKKKPLIPLQNAIRIYLNINIPVEHSAAFWHTLPFYRVYFLPPLFYRVYNLLTAYPQTAFSQRSLFDTFFDRIYLVYVSTMYLKMNEWYVLSAFFSENRLKDKHSKHAKIYLTLIVVQSYDRLLLGIQTAQALLVKILWKRSRRNEIEIL